MTSSSRHGDVYVFWDVFDVVGHAERAALSAEALL